MPDETRRRTVDELMADLLREQEFLVAGIQLMDDGDPLGVDAVAKACRKLAGTTNRGDRLLERTRMQAELQAPQLPRLSRQVKVGKPHLVFAFGAVPDPEDDGREGLWAPPDLESLVTAKCAILGSGQTQIEYAWHDLFSVVANKLSVHSDDEIPVYVDELCRYRLGGVPVLRSALRTIGWMVGSYAADLLRSAGQAPEPMPSLTDGTGSWIEWALVLIDDGSNLDVRVVGRLAPGELAAYNSDADVRWLHDPPNLDGSTIVRWDASTNPGRNDPCPCGSGIKYKRCHGVSG